MMKIDLKKSTKSGFTIVEFSLATAFIAFLLISIAVIAGVVSSIYQKGLTLKSVNSVGRGLIDDFTTSINAAPSVDTDSLCRSFIKAKNEDTTAQKACEKDHANKFIYQTKNGSRKIDGPMQSVQLGGVFCTGNYSYVWNTYYGLGENNGSGDKKNAMQLKYLNRQGFEITVDKANLMKIKDPNYRVCSTLVDEGNYTSKIDPNVSTVTVDITKLANGVANQIEDPTQDFLANSEVGLQLYELTIFPISQDAVTLRTFMSGTFVLATGRGNVNIQRSGNYCDVEGLYKANGDDYENAGSILDVGSEYNYCAINKFNFAARTAGM